MTTTFRLFLAIAIISLGGAMLGRVLFRWVKQKITRTQVFAGLLSGAAAVGIGAAFRVNRADNPMAGWIQLGCVLLFTAGILLDVQQRSRMNP
jgi:hypothetical protein